MSSSGGCLDDSGHDQRRRGNGMNARSILSILAMLVIAAAGPGCISRAWGQGIRIEIHPVRSVTLSEQEFLTGATGGQPAVLAGELRLPRTSGRLPVVVLVHGSGGVESNVSDGR